MEEEVYIGLDMLIKLTPSGATLENEYFNICGSLDTSTMQAMMEILEEGLKRRREARRLK